MSPRAVRIVFAVSLVAWLVNAAIQLLTTPLLGHDEAHYVLGAKDWLAGVHPRWYYLSVGMRYVTAPGLLAGGGELALRIVPTLLALGFVLVAVRIARNLGGAATAAWTMALLTATFAIAKRAADLLGDLPATGCLLAGVWVIATELTREGGLRWRFVLVAPCFAAAFYLRYGSVLPIVVISGAAVAVGWRAIVRRPLIALAAVAAFAVLFAPHLWLSLHLTGRALGILRESRDTIGAAYLGESLVAYATANPFTYYGIATTPAMLAGLAAIYRWRDRQVRLLWLIAVGDIVVLGLMPIPQVRYIYLGVVLLCILGVDAAIRWIAAARAPVRRVLVAAAILILVASWIVVVANSIRRPGERVRKMEATLTASAAVRDDARGAPCQVVCRRTTQIEWYSGCTTVLAVTPEIVASERVYVVLEHGGDYQPDLAALPGVPRVLVERPGVVTIMRLEPKP